MAFRSSNEKIQEEAVLVTGGDEEESPSGSVSNVVAQEDDVVWRAERRNKSFLQTNLNVRRICSFTAFHRSVNGFA